MNAEVHIKYLNNTGMIDITAENEHHLKSSS